MIRSRDFLEVRDYLYGLPSEASIRTRTSRVYYAAFLEALAYCEKSASYRRHRGPRERGAVADNLSTIDAGLALNLENLRKLRNAADYDLDQDLERIANDALWASTLAQAILAKLEDIGRA